MKKITQFIITACATILCAAHLQAQSPAAWWRAEGNALDSVGANNGVIQSSLSYVPGESGEAFSFAGGTVTVPDAASLDPATNLTVQIWVRSTAAYAYLYLLTKDGGAAGASYAFYTGNNGGLAFWVNVPGDTGYYGLIISPLAAPSAVWDGNWHQATGVYDGTAVHLYIDGVEVGTGTQYVGGASGGPVISYASAGPLVLGNFSPTASDAWPGALDDIKVFDRAMAASDVSDTFTNSSSSFATNGLASWWRADGNALDSWGSNPGTVNAETISFFQGKSGQAFLSAGGAIVVPDSPVLEPQTITVQAWVKSTSPGAYKYVLSKCRAPTWGSYALYTSGNGGMAFFVSVGPSGSGTLTLSPVASPGIVWDGAWHQVTGTYDGAAIHLYIDGLEVGTGTPAPGGIDYTNTSALHNGAFVIANDPTLGFAMSGGIDEIKIWDQALTAQQVMGSYQQGRLVSWWRAEGDDTDSVGTNNGTTIGTVTFAPSQYSGTAFKFAGGVVDVPDAPSLEPANLTVEALVRGAPPGTNKYVISKSLTAASPSYAFYTGAAGGLAFDATINGNVVSSAAINASNIWDGYFHFIAGTYDGQAVHFYVDGNEIGTGAPASGTVQYGTGQSGGDLLFGDFSSSLTSSNFVGFLDNVKLYNTALALPDIQADAFQVAIITSQPQSVQTTVGSTASFSVSALPPGVQYQWSFDGTNLPGATQAILNLNSVQAAQAGTYQVSVLVGSGLFVPDTTLGGEAFNLPGALVDVAKDPSLEPSGQVTVQAWIRGSASPGHYKYLLNKSLTGGVGSYAIYTAGSGGAIFYVYLAGEILILSPDAGTSIWDGNWHQLTGIYDGEFARMYVDGQQVGSGTDSLSGGPIDYTDLSVTGDLIIGDFGINPSGANYGGNIDEVKVFDLGLSDSDVMDTFTNINGNASTNGLISWWKGEGNALDSFGANNGVIVPGPGSIISDAAVLSIVLSPANFTVVGISGGLFHATLTGPNGQSFVIQRSASLPGSAWVPIITNTVPFSFTDALGTGSGFYRAVSY